MKFDEKLKKISKKPQKRLDRTLIILSLSLLIASFFSYFVIDAFGQQYLQLDCPKNAYHGLDNQGNETCRDILTNQILEPESVIVVDSDLKKITSDSWIDDSETGDIINDDQTLVIGFIILVGIGIIGVGVKNKKLEIFQRQGLSDIQKKQVRDRQYSKCNMCFTPPTKWKYDYVAGNKSHNDLNNCQGLCSDCYSMKTQRDKQSGIYQK
jgi:hypothetical protein